MKLRKLISAAAATAVAAASFATIANAALVVPDTVDPGASIGTGAYLVQVFNVGNEAEGKPATDYGIDLSKVAAVSVTIKAVEPDYIDGGIGGSITFSCNGEDIASGTDLWNKYNWPNCEYWGFVDEDLEIDTLATDKPAQAVKVGDYTYKITNNTLVNPIAAGDAQKIGCMQVGIQYWGGDMSDYEVIECAVLDASGNALVTFDGTGKATVGGASAPAAEEKPAAEEEPAAGNVDAATDSSKGSPDTGVEDVAVVAGLAIVAAGAVLVSKKRK